jgi:hypothetical protein
LSQRIIQDHGGSIAVDSVAGKGTTFAITLPTIGESSSGRVTLPPRDKPAVSPQSSVARSNQSGRN